MAKNESSNLGYLGYSFQVKLVKQLIEDQKFSESIISIVDPNYFDNEYMRLVVASVKNYYEKYETIPSYDTIFNLIKTEVRREIARESANELIKEVKDSAGISLLIGIPTQTCGLLGLELTLILNSFLCCITSFT